MDKVLSAIKSLECVAILQVNVKEGTPEVVHSGHGSASGSSPGYVKKEEIEETDASKMLKIQFKIFIIAQKMIPPVHADTFSERKRNSSATSDASTTLPKTRKKVKTGKDNLTQQSKTGFDEKCNQLLRFKEKFGHCNVPQTYADNPSLGQWCSHRRHAYKKIQRE